MKNPTELIQQFVSESVRVKQEFFRNNSDMVVEAADAMAQSLRRGRKILLFGNGGSAADAQHIAAEFVGRFIPDRSPLPALSLSCDPSVLTALGNDYGYSAVFARQVVALGNADDVAIGISTSGNSPNVLEGLKAAQIKGLLTIAFTGEDGGKIKECARFVFRVPSRVTPRIQETHITLGHILCELIDRDLFPEAYDRD